jgi:hypothetical protein
MATSKKSSILGAILNGPPVPEEKTRPGVFIIESLGFRDERKKRFEGQILRDMLTLSGKEVQYWYVRTWKELTEEIFQRFYDSKLRYLHLSCHGNSTHVCLTLDNVPFKEFGEEISNYLPERRLFVSACEVVNPAFSKAVNPDGECYSIIGPRDEIRFDDAAVMWASFYHLMLRDSKVMRSKQIRATLTRLKETFGQTFLYL